MNKEKDILSKEEKVTSHDFNSGVCIKPFIISQWHEDAVDKVKNGNPYWIISSGNSMVIAKAVIYYHEPEETVIEVIEITNGYKKYIYHGIEVKKIHPTHKEQCIAFVEWVDKNYQRVDIFHDNEWWRDRKDLFIDTMFTTEQLYELYISQQQNKIQ